MVYLAELLVVLA